MTPKRFEHSPRPTPPLPKKHLQLVRRLRETTRILGMTDAPAALEHRPRQHDVFADAFDPSADLLDGRAFVQRERALRRVSRETATASV